MTQPSVLEEFRVEPGARERGERWAQILREAYFGDTIRPLDGPACFGGTLRKRLLDDCLVASVASAPYKASFEPGSKATEHLVLYEVSSQAREWVTFLDGRRVENGANVVLFDNASIRSAGQRSELVGSYLYLPKDSLRSRGIQLGARGRPVVLDAMPYARLVMDLAKTMLRPGVVAPNEALALKAAILDLLAGMKIDAEPETSVAVSEAMRRRVEAWVVERLALGPVTPAETAQAHGISLRSLHRLFDGSGRTFSAFVRSARLEQARLGLASTGLTVQDIAARWGFSDVSHFCREFKRHFGLTTSDFRAALHDQTDARPVTVG